MVIGLTVRKHAKIDFQSSSLGLRNSHHGIGGFRARAPTRPVRMTRSNKSS